MYPPPSCSQKWHQEADPAAAAIIMLGFFFFHSVQDVGALLGFVWERGCLLQARPLECGWPLAAQHRLLSVFHGLLNRSPEPLSPRHCPSRLPATHLTPQLSHLAVHARARTQLILQVFRHAAQLILVCLLEDAELQRHRQPGHEDHQDIAQRQCWMKVSTSQGNGGPRGPEQAESGHSVFQMSVTSYLITIWPFGTCT